jgi:hypothetical protein
MLTIITNKKTISIDINLLKSKLKKAIITILKISIVACGLYGLFLIIGTEGASKEINIPMFYIIKQIIKGGIFCGIGCGLNIIKKVLEA